MRLIDSDSLVVELRKQANLTSFFYKANEQCGNDGGMNFYLGKCEGYENSAYHAENICPTIDAQPVRHGNWIPCDGDKSRGQYYTFKCSCCEKYTILAKMERYCDYNYCPYCSARMVTDDV